MKYPSVLINGDRVTRELRTSKKDRSAHRYLQVGTSRYKIVNNPANVRVVRGPAAKTLIFAAMS
jgi:hypothetical protein